MTRVKMSRMRLRTAERLKDSQNTAAMLTTFNEIDMTLVAGGAIFMPGHFLIVVALSLLCRNIKALRAKYKDEFQKKHGVKLGFMSAFAKASAKALMDVPAVNACLCRERPSLSTTPYSCFCPPPPILRH